MVIVNSAFTSCVSLKRLTAFVGLTLGGSSEVM